MLVQHNALRVFWRVWSRVLAALAVMTPIIGATGIARGASFSYEAIDTGWYTSAGAHTVGNTNYYVGHSAGPHLRDYFIFDLSTLVIGPNEQIASATFTVYSAEVGTSDPSETVTFYDVSTLPATLSAGIGGVGAYNDLGSGTEYASHIFFPRSLPNATNEVIPLNIDAITAITGSAGGQFGIGGALTTAEGPAGEAVFIGSDGLDIQRLDIVTEAVPEPASLSLVGVGGLMLLRRRKVATRV